MSKGRIAVTTTSFAAADAAHFRLMVESGYDVVLNATGRRLTPDESIELMAEAVGVVAGTNVFNDYVLRSLPGLRVISRCGVGVDSIDFDVTEELGIEVLTTPGPVTAAVAELTIGMMLALLRRIPEADRALRKGDWDPLLGGLLSERLVGIVGFGRIGQRVAQLVTAFGGDVIAYDPFNAPEPAVAAASIDELLTRADVVTLHVPLTPETKGLIGTRELALLKPTAILVNAARGGLVDEAALDDALRGGQLAGAALDTFEEEPYLGALAKHDNVVLTAHMGSLAAESREQMERDAVANLLSALERL